MMLIKKGTGLMDTIQEGFKSFAVHAERRGNLFHAEKPKKEDTQPIEFLQEEHIEKKLPTLLLNEEKKQEGNLQEEKYDTGLQGERNASNSKSNNDEHITLNTLYRSPEFRAKYERYREYNYKKLYEDIYYSVIKGKMTLDKLKVITCLLVACIYLAKATLALFKVIPGASNSIKSKMKDLETIIRAEDTIQHMQKTVGVFISVTDAIEGNVWLMQKLTKIKKKKGSDKREEKINQYNSAIL